MSSAPTPSEIAADATWLAQAMDPVGGAVRLVRMTDDDYRAASFLDDRLFQTPRDFHALAWQDASAGLDESARADARWIFHIGHVGSTLVSRLLGELPGVLSLREPRLLRDVTQDPGDASRYIPGVRRLLSRTFTPDETAIVKATSFVSEIAANLVAPDGHALFVYAGPTAFLGTCLAGENTMKEVMALSAARQRRMADRVQLTPLPDRPAHHVAAAWACEMTALEAAANALPDGLVQWLEFDQFLADPAKELAGIAEFFGIEAQPDQLSAIVGGPLMRRYSKALEYDYSPQLRLDLIAEATAAHTDDIADALAMLDSAAQDSPLLARALERSKAVR
jgi:hypothetical protein